MILDRGCFERGCACYDERVDKDGVEVIKKEWVGLTRSEAANLWADAHDIDGKMIWTPSQLFEEIDRRLRERNT